MIAYVSARFSYQKPACSCANLIEQELGWIVRARWLTEEPPFQMSDWNNPENAAYLARAAQIDAEDVDACDVMVAFTEDPMQPHLRGGRHVEFGMALQAGARMVVIGPRENVFHFLPGVEQYDCLDAFIVAAQKRQDEEK